MDISVEARRNAAGVGPAVEVRRSARRRRTVSAYRDGETIVVLIPNQFTAEQEHEWVAKMLRRLSRRGARGKAVRRSDAALLGRARELSQRYLDSACQPTSVRWVSNQRSRWGSCTPSDGSIRLSSRLTQLPPWVIDYVLVHELVHLIVPGHNEKFWRLVERYPRSQRALGYLEGVAAAAHLTFDEDCA